MALSLICTPVVTAAVTEREVMDKIHDNLAVLRYFYRMKADAEYGLEMCRTAKALAEKQLASVTGLLQAEKAKLEINESQNLTREELQELAKVRIEILQKQGLTENDLKALVEAEKAQLTEILKPDTLKEDELAKQIQAEKTKLASFFQRRLSADNDLFDAGKGKLLGILIAKGEKDKEAMIEAEKARVRDLLKRKDVTGRDLLAIENAMLDFLSNVKGAADRTPEAIKTRGQVERVAAIQVRVDALQRQLRRLERFDFERTYKPVIVDSKAKIEKLTFDLDVRLAEFEVLFGKKALIEVAWEQEMAKYHPKRENLAFFMDLN